jgi:O-antigen biosynthesis protein
MKCEVRRLSPEFFFGVAAFKLDRDDSLEAVVSIGSQSLPARIRWMPTPGPVSSELKAFTVSISASLNGHVPEVLEVRRAGGDRVLGPVTLVVMDVEEKAAPEALRMLDSHVRDDVVQFVCSAATAHSAKRRDIRLSKNLFAFRETLREKLPPLLPDKERLVGGALDVFIGLDETAFYMQGWLQTADVPLTRLTAVAPDGARAELLDGLFRYCRQDVQEFYGTASDGPVAKAGFIAYFETDLPSFLSEGWVLEVENEVGDACELLAPPVERDWTIAPKRMLGSLPLSVLPDDELMSRHISPAITRWQKRQKELENDVDVIPYGQPPESPEVSIVIPLFERIDFVQHQLAQFALDPEMKASELIYVLDSPELAHQLRDTAAHLHSLYRVPFTVLVPERGSGFAGATNIGTSRARGRLLLLLNSDVLPDKPGWLGRLAAFYDSDRNIGALGPKLLHEDDSLQHAGMYFYLPKDTAHAGLWANVHYFKGLDRNLPAADVARSVPALTGACLMVERKLYEDVGGFPEVYVQGDHEDSDLCLRLIDAGYENWYVPEVELYHLEAQSYPFPVRGRTALYNRWLHTKRWGKLIEAVMNRYPGEGAVVDVAEASKG